MATKTVSEPEMFLEMKKPILYTEAATYQDFFTVCNERGIKHFWAQKRENYPFGWVVRLSCEAKEFYMYHYYKCPDALAAKQYLDLMFREGKKHHLTMRNGSVSWV
jgi:hypothetical protein